jgi:hypothetical protein
MALDFYYPIRSIYLFFYIIIDLDFLQAKRFNISCQSSLPMAL